MKRLLILVALAVGASVAMAQSESPQVRREVEQVFFRMDRVSEKGDVNGFITLLAPNVCSRKPAERPITMAPFEPWLETL